MKNSIFARFVFLGLLTVGVRAIGDAYMQLEVQAVPRTSSAGVSLEETARIETLRIGESLFCSDRLAALLQRCTKDRLATEDRDEAAMLFTLCDRGRDYPPPMECEGLRESTDGTDKIAIRRCAIALDQHQNFQRAFDVYRILVIPEKCRSLNGIFNVDPSRDVYKNITHELTNFLQAISRREAKTDEYFSRWDDRLNAFEDTTADLSLTRHSLTNFNERFVDNLNGLLQMVNLTFDGLSSEALRTSREASAELKEEMNRIREEHAILLALAVTSLEKSISEGLSSVFDSALERQNNLDLATELTVKQLVGVIEELMMARQDFEALSVFVKEMTSKAYNQALLLDVGIREDAMDEFAINGRRSEAAWLNAVQSLRSLLSFLGLSPFWALSFFVLSLPRFVVEQTSKVVLWSFVFLLSFLARTLLGHRKVPDRCDEERRVQDYLSVQPLGSPHLHGPDYAFPRITYAESDKASCRADPLLRTIDPIDQAEKVLSDWTAIRSRARMSGFSRIPARLYANNSGGSIAADAFSQARNRRLL
ncbi:hypothetical protein A7U60_g6384 [Sanghuangporus baumii]|uniref:Karyogamy protein 5 n=1 Tax=Sanghuangporus baumii TaxID=108892 RepID=A0A9Q5N1V4_SANBA|nr:hypothetical protein A7U60_g6384 [Sanghuangporus baumii]